MSRVAREVMAFGIMLVAIALLACAYIEQLPEAPPEPEKPKVEDPEEVKPVRLAEEAPQLTFTDEPVVPLLAFAEIPMANTLTFGSGTIVIDLDTGAVTLKNPPDEAAREFWAAVEHFAVLRCEQ